MRSIRTKVPTTAAPARVKSGTSKAATAARKAQFVDAYIANGGNATQAAIDAGYSVIRARSTGAELVADRNISAEIARRRAEVVAQAEKSTGISFAGLLRELHAMAHTDPRAVFDSATGALLAPHLWPDEVARSISSVKVVEIAGGLGAEHIPAFVKEVKFWDKNSAIEKAMRHLGLFEKDNRQVGEGFAERLVRARTRSAGT
jgi:phage terminase small subunit